MFSSSRSTYMKLVSDTALNYRTFAGRCSRKLFSQEISNKNTLEINPCPTFQAFILKIVNAQDSKCCMSQNKKQENPS